MALQISLMEQRRIEAGVLGPVFRVLENRRGRDEALEVIGQAAEASARAAGQEFAKGAQNGPSLSHFATVLERLCGDNAALEIKDLRLEANTFSFRVTRCAYIDMYLAMGLPLELAQTLSCRRDGAFARGYSLRLAMERDGTVGGVGNACSFVYTWDSGSG